ncbi:MAG: pitrilysin family protein [Ignavibacteria bacterium]
MKKYIFILLTTLISLNILSAQKPDRSKPPAPGAAPEIKLSDYDRIDLPNGLKVFIVENHQLPVVSMSLVLDRDPIMEDSATGYLNIAGDLLRTGTKTRTKDQIDEETDFIGASLSTSSAGLFASSLKQHFEKLMDLASDIIINPVFKQEELDKLKTKTMSSLAASRDEPGTIADRIVKMLYYGRSHPYSEFETEKSVGNITLRLCRDYYDSYFKPNITYIAIVGDITKKEAEPLVNKYFGAWKKAEVKHFVYAKPAVPLTPRVAVVDRAASVQSVIRIGHPADLKTGSEDVIKAGISNTILGGGVFRLFKNLREKHAYTYGAYSGLHPDQLAGNFTASTSVRNIVTDSAITEILSEMKRIRTEKTEEAELQQAKNYTSGNFALSLERPETIGQFAINIERYKLPKDYYSGYLKKVAAVTSDEVRAMANKYIQPDNSYIIVVGNASEIAGRLKKFSPAGIVEFYDIYGAKYDPSLNKIPEGVNAKSVIDNYIQKLGGRDNLLKVKDRTTEMSGSTQGIPVKINVYQKQPNKLYQEVKAGAMHQKIIFNGKKGVQISIMGKQEIKGDQLEELKLEANLNAVLDYGKAGITTRLTGMEKLDGNDTYRIEFTSATGLEWYEYYDTVSGLRLRQTKTIKSPTGEISQITDFGDYKEVNGVKYPFFLSQSMGTQRIDLKVDNLKVNSNPDNGMFNIDK